MANKLSERQLQVFLFKPGWQTVGCSVKFDMWSDLGCHQGERITILKKKNMCFCHSIPKRFPITDTASACGSELITVENNVLVNGKQKIQLRVTKKSSRQMTLFENKVQKATD